MYLTDRWKKCLLIYKKSAQMKSEIYIRGREENHIYPKKFQTGGQTDIFSFRVSKQLKGALCFVKKKEVL